MKTSRFIWRRLFVPMLAAIGLTLEPAMATDSGQHRPAKNDRELRYWLENMLGAHHFSLSEAASVLGKSPAEVEREAQRLRIHHPRSPSIASRNRLRVLPYPGGRHPRIGFLEGAIHPQRETKISVFTPWDDASYVVVDVPEALFTNLGLTYLAHTHIPTLWDKEGRTLEPLEWNRRANGSLDFTRTLPNGIVFGTRVVPKRDKVQMEIWLKNGTSQTLSSMRIQNCVMLKAARGFEAQSNGNKILRGPYAAAKSSDGTRWIITAWSPLQRAWANPPVPCIHSDPALPDCAPGKTVRTWGELWFYSGNDIDRELERHRNSGWDSAK